MSDDLEALRPELERLDALIDAEMHRMRARYELSRDELHGLYVTDDQVDALLRSGRPAPQTPPPPEIADIRSSDTSSRWAKLAEALALDEDERDLVVICLAPEFDRKYEPLYAYLNDDAARRWPTMELAVRLLSRDDSHAVRLRGLLLPNARLFATHLLETLAEPRDAPRSQRPLRLAPAIPDWLRGLAYVDDRLAGIVRFGALEKRLPDEALPAGIEAGLAAVAERLRAGTPMPAMVLTAASAREAVLFAEEMFVRAERMVLVVDLAALNAHGSPAVALSAAELQASVLRLGIVVQWDEGPGEPDRRPFDAVVVPPLHRFVQRLPAVVLAGAASPDPAARLADLPVLRVEIPDMSARERAALWRAALTGDGDGEAPDDDFINAVADRFVLGPDRVFLAAAAAGNLAGLAGLQTPGADELFAAARAVSVSGPGGTTSVVRTTYTWKDLILPRHLEHRLEDVIAAIEHRSRVLDEWGLARRTGGARGIAVMFAGPSGTGKTMAASVVAERLRLDLHRIELGAVISKYIGETEKNLDQAFEAARRANALLFIDEADALLGKRSEVRDAHDRYANVEVAYLLQKLEDHDGVVIVATNLAQNIDEAFSRRLQYVIEFPLPETAMRERLWCGMVPAAPREEGIDFAFLARQFELSGGEIRNIVLDAAYRAAGDGTPITFASLVRAVARHYAKRGQVLTKADMREHHRLFADDAPDPPESEPAGAALRPAPGGRARRPVARTASRA